MTILAKIRWLARALYRVRWLLWAGGAGAAVALVVGVLGGADSQGSVLFALLGFLWAAFLLALAYAFPSEPLAFESGTGAWTRFKTKAWRAFQWLLAVGSLLLGASLAWLTLRAAGIALG